jgi:tetratricopeptide (TPR) repeat protein
MDAARAALAARQRDEAISAHLAEARAQSEQREFQKALQLVNQAIARHGEDRRLVATRDDVLAAKAKWERTAAIRDLTEQADALAAQQQFDRAITLLELGVKRHGADPHLAEALAGARAALAAKRHDEAIDSVCKQAHAQTEKQDFSRALKVLDRGAAEHGRDARFAAMRENVLAAEGEWKRDRFVRLTLADAENRLAQGKPEMAVPTLEAALTRYPADPQLTEAFDRARHALEAVRREEAIRLLLAQAGNDLKSRNWALAIDAIERGLTQYGSDHRLADLRDNVLSAKAQSERAEALRRLVQDAASRIRAREPEEALTLLEAARSQFESEPEFEEVVCNARDAVALKETAIAALSRETRLFLGRQDFPTALAMVEEGLKTYGSDETQLADLRENVLAAQADWQRTEALRQALEEAGNLVGAGTPEKACRLLEQILSRFPGNPVLLDAHGKALELANLKRREASIQKVFSEARSHLERGRSDLALQQIERALADYSEDRRLLELHQSALSAKAEAQRIAEAIRSVVQSAEALSERGEREEAIALLEKALSEHPGHPELVSAIVGTIDAVGAAGTVAIDKICRNARQYMLTGNFDLAFHTIDQALRLHGDEQQTAVHEAPQKARTEAAKAAVAGGGATALHRESGFGASVKEETGEHALPEIREQTDEIPVIHEALEPPGIFFDPAVVERGKPNKWWMIISAAALLMATAFVVINFIRTPKLGTLSIRTVPARANIHVNDQSCSAPNCEFRLKPGQYHIQVSAGGYRQRTETATVRAGSAQPGLEITLEPLSPTARVSANFSDGDVTLDNHPAGRIEDGQFGLDHLNPGRHSLQISSREGKASVSFDIDYARLPVFHDISQQNTTLIASASFADRAVVTCSGCSGAVSLDGRPAGELTNGAITLDKVSPGTHRVRIGDDRTLVFSATGAPGVNLVVTSDRNFGALIVDTGEDNATVYIDGNKYPRLTSHGQLLIPAEAKQHRIRVAKEGYRAEPPEIRAQLTKGDQFQARFKLVPEPARLIVSRQLAGADVLVDGSKVGTIASDGTFSAQVSPGDHRIQFSKDGLSSPQAQRSFGPGRSVTLSRSDAPLAAKVVSPPAVSDNPSLPPKPDSEAAGKRLKELQQQQAAAVREQAWAAVDQNSKASLEQFLAKYGEGSHAQDARTTIGSIESQQLKAAQEAQKANEQASRNAADANAVTGAIGQFEAAFNRRDLPGLQAIWTGMPKGNAEVYRAEFRDAKSLTFHLTPIAQPKVSGDSASVICTRSQTFVAKNGQHPPPTSEAVRVDLARAGSQWVIRRISPLGSE